MMKGSTSNRGSAHSVRCFIARRRKRRRAVELFGYPPPAETEDFRCRGEQCGEAGNHRAMTRSV